MIYAITGVLYVEGDVTTDGRMIERGGLVVDRLPIPIRNSAEAQSPTGRVDSISVDDGVVRFEGELEDAADLIGQGLRPAFTLANHSVSEVEDNITVITSGALRELFLTESPAFPRAHIELKEGDT